MRKRLAALIIAAAALAGIAAPVAFSTASATPAAAGTSIWYHGAQVR